MEQLQCCHAFVGALHGYGTHSPSLLCGVVSIAGFPADYRFISGYGGSLREQIRIRLGAAVAFHSSRQQLSVQIASVIKQKENVTSPRLLLKVCWEQRCILPHLSSPVVLCQCWGERQNQGIGHHGQQQEGKAPRLEARHQTLMVVRGGGRGTPGQAARRVRSQHAVEMLEVLTPPLNHALNFSLAKQTQQRLKGVGNAHG